MKFLNISVDGRFWKVQLDVRHLGEHLDFTRRVGLVLCLAESRRPLLV